MGKATSTDMHTTTLGTKKTTEMFTTTTLGLLITQQTLITSTTSHFLQPTRTPRTPTCQDTPQHLRATTTTCTMMVGTTPTWHTTTDMTMEMCTSLGIMRMFTITTKSMEMSQMITIMGTIQTTPKGKRLIIARSTQVTTTT